MTRTFDADGKWLGHGAGGRYAGQRFRSRSSADRDPRRIGSLVARHLGPAADARILDVPCGAGRLHPALRDLAGAYIGADRSAEMLSGWAPSGAPSSAPSGAPSRVPARVVASVAALPFATGSFDAVVCCRLLHHLDEQRELPDAIAELVRVSRALVVATFWDAASWHAWRRRRGWRRDTTGRRAVDKALLAAAFARAGADVVEWSHSFRFVSQQAFLVAHKRS